MIERDPFDSVIDVDVDTFPDAVFIETDASVEKEREIVAVALTAAHNLR